MHTSSQWQVKNTDGSWSDYTAATYDKGVYRCAYTLWIEPYKDKAQFSAETLNVEIDTDATEATVVNSTEGGVWRQTAVVYSREYTIDPSKIVIYDTVTATVPLNPVYGAPVYGSYLYYTQEFTVTNSGAPIYILGDTNGDNMVDIRDVTAIQRYLAGFPAESFNEAAADIDGNGVSITDATLIQSYLADFETELPIGCIVIETVSVNT